MLMRHTFFTFFCVTLAVIFYAHPTFAVAPQFDFSTVAAQSVLVIDVNSKKIVLQKNADAAWPVASITKLMTSLVVLAQVQSLSRVSTITKADEVAGARLRVPTGSRVSRKDMLYAALIGSANNAANAVARSTGLSKKVFVRLMNTKAKKIGMKQTLFVDASGISPKNVSTATDIATLALVAFAQKTIRAAVQLPQYTVRVSELVKVGKVKKWQTVLHPIKSTNALLVDDVGDFTVLGGKTGYLPESQWNFVTEIQNAKNKPVLIVVLGSPTAAQVFADTRTLAEWVWQ